MENQTITFPTQAPVRCWCNVEIETSSRGRNRNVLLWDWLAGLLGPASWIPISGSVPGFVLDNSVLASQRTDPCPAPASGDWCVGSSIICPPTLLEVGPVRAVKTAPAGERSPGSVILGPDYMVDNPYERLRKPVVDMPLNS